MILSLMFFLFWVSEDELAAGLLNHSSNLNYTVSKTSGFYFFETKDDREVVTITVFIIVMEPKYWPFFNLWLHLEDSKAEAQKC